MMQLMPLPVLIYKEEIAVVTVHIVQVLQLGYTVE